MHIQISDSEWKIMNLLWENNPQTANEIIGQLSATEWSPRTVRSLISRLIKKEAIRFEQIGREYFYYPMLDRTAYVSEERESFLEKCYNNSVSMMVSQLLKEEKLSGDEIEALKKLLEGDNNE